MNTSRILAATAALAAALLAAPAQAADTFVNLSVGGALSPGVYGMVNIGNAPPPPPPVVYAQPVLAVPQPVAVAPLPPAYLYVPPGHRKNWKRHCAHYNACGRPVYFVNADARGHYIYPRGQAPVAVVPPPPGRGYDRHDHDRDHGPRLGRDRDHDRDRR